MYYHTLLLLLASSLLASASPLHSLSRRNPCDGVDARPILYHEYHNDVCPPKNKLKEQKHGNKKVQQCGPLTQWNECTSFCQIRTSFAYGQEQPFPNAYCRGPFSCSISESKSRSITLGASFSPKIGKALKVGVSGSFSWSQSEAYARSYSIDLEKGECGYFTFVPVTKEVCGTLTSSLYAEGYCFPSYAENQGNFCAKELFHYPPGEGVDGETLFVRTDCVTRMPLPVDEQDPVYGQPGVPLNRGVQEAWAKAWGNDDLITSSALECDEIKPDTPKKEHCDAAFLQLATFADQGLNNVQEKTWAAYVLSCVIVVVFDEWEESCDATQAEVAIAAYNLIEICSDDGKIGGRRPLKSGKCASHIEIKNLSGEDKPDGS